MRIIIGQIPIGAPFPNIARHVEQAIAIRWKSGDGRGGPETIFRGVLSRESPLPNICGPFAAGFLFVAPNIWLAIETSTRRIFPFSLRRQTLACPLAIGDCI